MCFVFIPVVFVTAVVLGSLVSCCFIVADMFTFLLGLWRKWCRVTAFFLFACVNSIQSPVIFHKLGRCRSSLVFRVASFLHIQLRQSGLFLSLLLFSFPTSIFTRVQSAFSAVFSFATDSRFPASFYENLIHLAAGWVLDSTWYWLASFKCFIPEVYKEERGFYSGRC